MLIVHKQDPEERFSLDPTTHANEPHEHQGAHPHNPAIFYDIIDGAGGVWSATSQVAECLANDTPAGTTGPDEMSTFNAAAEAGTGGRVSMIVANLCEDGHDGCHQPLGNCVTRYDLASGRSR